MLESGHLGGGAGVHRDYKIGASFASVGVIAIDGTAGVIPCTTTDFGDTPGLALHTATYSTTQGDAEGLVKVSVRPDLIIKALMSGGATEGTALTLLANTVADTAGLTITDADVGAADMDSGTVWCTKGANVGQSRLITTHTGSTSFAVTVPFLNDIAVGDEFLFCPWGMQGSGSAGSDGVGNVQATTNFTQADASIASGTGGVATVVDLELNGRTDSAVLFVLADHIFGVATV
jgi:hypothetical protein